MIIDEQTLAAGPRTGVRQGRSEPTAGPHAGSAWWDATTVLLVLLAIMVLLPRLTQTLVAPKNRLDVRDPVQYIPVAAAIEVAGQLLVFGWCAFVIARRSGRLPTDRGVPLLLLLAAWISVVVRDLYLSNSPTPGALLFPIVVVALWVLRPPLARLAVVGLIGTTTAVISMLLGLAQPDKGLLVTTTGDTVAPDKEILPIGILVGPFSGGNNLGRALALALPCLAMLRTWPTRVAAATPILMALVWTSSRSSLAAAGVAVLGMALLTAMPHANRLSAAVGLCGVFGALVAIVPLTWRGPTDFTNRGLIWSNSLERWLDEPLFGLGSRWYARAADYGESISGSAYHGHNQFVHVLTTNGLVGLVLALVVTGYAVTVAGRWALAGSSAPAGFLLALLVSCMLEVSFGVVDRASLIVSAMVTFMLILLARRGYPPDSVRRATGGRG